MAIVPIRSRPSATVCLFWRVAGVGRDRDMGAICTPIRRLKVVTVPTLFPWMCFKAAALQRRYRARRPHERCKRDPCALF
ncbi:hypothetical protein C8R44DRAFT_887835 [Mycena epipterygia]|nr:hypothetical protein C8R44DRAFT_887835 [Mycena epipterygia]